MTKKEFILLLVEAKIFQRDRIIISEKDLFDLMESELEKPVDEIDTKLVDFCVDTLSGKFGEPFEKQ